MSRKNNSKNSKTVVTEKENIQENIQEKVSDELVHTVHHGYVSGCAKLNVRKEANKDAEVLCIIDEKSELVVDEDASTEEFYKVITAAGIDGYCMKKFIDIK